MRSYINKKDFLVFFQDLEAANNRDDLEKLFITFSLKRRDKKYLDIEYDISKEDIEQLIKTKFLTNEFSLNPLLAKNINLTLLEKLLFALCWKNGHLGKELRIILGILGLNNFNVNSGIVFNQFGKHLNNKDEIIIDQHVMRAYIFYKEIKKGNEGIIKKDISPSDYIYYLDDYKSWINNNELYRNNKRLLDELLFSLGKNMKKVIK